VGCGVVRGFSASSIMPVLVAGIQRLCVHAVKDVHRRRTSPFAPQTRRGWFPDEHRAEEK
jgi:hypothetical protein